MNDSMIENLRLVLTDRPHEGDVAVDLVPFIRFNCWINESLAAMEDRWAPLAAPGDLHRDMLSRR